MAQTLTLGHGLIHILCLTGFGDDVTYVYSPSGLYPGKCCCFCSQVNVDNTALQANKAPGKATIFKSNVPVVLVVETAFAVLVC